MRIAWEVTIAQLQPTGLKPGTVCANEPSANGKPLGDAVVIGDPVQRERELVVQSLDTHLGKIKDISAGALMDIKGALVKINS